MTVANRDADVTRYSRQDALRILHLQMRQIHAWERAGLIPQKDSYSFEELGQLRTLRDLQAKTRISAKSIRASVDAMQRVAGMTNPLLESSAVRRGSRLAFRHAGALVDPITQQLAFDFCYDKKLYDRLEHSSAEEVRLHLCADLAYQNKLLRFIENHDEPRATATFPAAKLRAALLPKVATDPGSGVARNPPRPRIPRQRLARGAVDRWRTRSPRCRNSPRGKRRNRASALLQAQPVSR